jgi:hypothetical protein
MYGTLQTSMACFELACFCSPSEAQYIRRLSSTLIQPKTRPTYAAAPLVPLLLHHLSVILHQTYTRNLPMQQLMQLATQLEETAVSGEIH